MGQNNKVFAILSSYGLFGIYHLALNFRTCGYGLALKLSSALQGNNIAQLGKLWQKLVPTKITLIAGGSEQITTCSAPDIAFVHKQFLYLSKNAFSFGV
jgi:hypothetical protein